MSHPRPKKSEIFDVCVMVLCGNHATLAIGVCLSFCIITAFRGARVAQWWEHSPSTNVALVRTPASAPYVGIICFCWFSPLLREVFLQVLQFSFLLKKPTLPVSNSIWNARTCFSKFLRTRKCSLDNLVPRRCDPSGQHQGSLRRIRKISDCK